MPLLLDEDYDLLKEQGLMFIEDEEQRFLILQDYQLPKGVNNRKAVMFW